MCLVAQAASLDRAFRRLMPAASSGSPATLGPKPTREESASAWSDSSRAEGLLACHNPPPLSFPVIKA